VQTGLRLWQTAHVLRPQAARAPFRVSLFQSERDPSGQEGRPDQRGGHHWHTVTDSLTQSVSSASGPLHVLSRRDASVHFPGDASFRPGTLPPAAAPLQTTWGRRCGLQVQQPEGMAWLSLAAFRGGRQPSIASRISALDYLAAYRRPLVAPASESGFTVVVVVVVAVTSSYHWQVGVQQLRLVTHAPQSGVLRRWVVGALPRNRPSVGDVDITVFDTAAGPLRLARWQVSRLARQVDKFKLLTAHWCDDASSDHYPADPRPDCQSVPQPE